MSHPTGTDLPRVGGRARLAVLLLAAVSCARVQPATSSTPRVPVGLNPRSAAISEVHYDVTVDSAATQARQLAVAMTFRVASDAPVVLALPAWTPGHYVLLWFARRVSGLTAEQGGQPLPWHKTDFQTWEIRPTGAGTVRVSFKYVADTIDRAVAWTRPDFAFFNGTNVFLYPVGQGFEWPATVTVHTEPGWRVVTGMDPAPGERTFGAANYHDLVDMPFFVGRFDVDSTRSADRWIRLAMYPAGTLTPARRDRTFGWLQRFVPVEAAVFRDVPFRNYTIFLVSDTVVNGGGLEHQDSQMDEVVTGALDAPWLPYLYSHEFFHAWNVKRLRPSEMVPYRYDDAQPTPWLWVSEGVTDYYADLALVRSGIIDSAQFLDATAGAVAAVLGTPAVSLSDASLSPWIGPLDGTGGIYYPKGALAGFLLDILIRDASGNQRSLDDVLRGLYGTVYVSEHRGFTAADFWGAVERAAGGRSFAGFRRRYIEGAVPFPLDSVLALGALRMVADTVREPRLGIATATDSSGVRVTQLAQRGAGAAAGLRAGDVIRSIGSVPIRDDASFEAFRAKYAGTTVGTLPMEITREGQALTVQLPVRLVARGEVRVVLRGDATPKARAIWRGIITGRTGG